MAFKFITQPLLSGLYEPEGIYLHSPLASPCPVVQLWGEHAEFHSRFTYQGVPLKGHIGLDFSVPLGTTVLAADQGRVVEMNYEAGGFGRYLKLEHSWGETLYAHLDEALVEAGQLIGRGHALARSGDNGGQSYPQLHFGLRIKPFNRFDGWGGFSDPLPYLSATDLILPEDEAETDRSLHFPPVPMLLESGRGRRP